MHPFTTPLRRKKASKRAFIGIATSLLIAASLPASAQVSWVSDKAFDIHFGNPYFTEGAAISSEGLVFALPGYEGATIKFKAISGSTAKFSTATDMKPTSAESQDWVWLNSAWGQGNATYTTADNGGLLLRNVGDAVEVTFSGLPLIAGFHYTGVSSFLQNGTYTAPGNSSLTQTAIFSLNSVDFTIPDQGIMFSGMRVELASPIPEPSSMLLIGCAGILIPLRRRRDVKE